MLSTTTMYIITALCTTLPLFLVHVSFELPHYYFFHPPTYFALYCSHLIPEFLAFLEIQPHFISISSPTFRNVFLLVPYSCKYRTSLFLSLSTFPTVGLPYQSCLFHMQALHQLVLCSILYNKTNLSNKLFYGLGNHLSVRTCVKLLVISTQNLTLYQACCKSWNSSIDAWNPHGWLNQRPVPFVCFPAFLRWNASKPCTPCTVMPFLTNTNHSIHPPQPSRFLYHPRSLDAPSSMVIIINNPLSPPSHSYITSSASSYPGKLSITACPPHSYFSLFCSSRSWVIPLSLLFLSNIYITGRGYGSTS